MATVNIYRGLVDVRGDDLREVEQVTRSLSAFLRDLHLKNPELVEAVHQRQYDFHFGDRIDAPVSITSSGSGPTAVSIGRGSAASILDARVEALDLSHLAEELSDLILALREADKQEKEDKQEPANAKEVFPASL